MGVRVIRDWDEGYGAIYDSVTETVFGKLFKLHTEEPEEFLKWLGDIDARRLSDSEFESYMNLWRERLAVQAENEEEEWQKWKAGLTVASEITKEDVLKAVKILKPNIDIDI